MSKISIRKEKQQSLSRRHPWVFSGAIYKKDKGIKDGDIVELIGFHEETLGYGHYQKGSIAVRMLTFDSTYPDASFWDQKILNAYQLRQALDIIRTDNNSYRLVNGEGDGLPGLIIDVYNNNAVVQCHSVGMFRQIEDIKNSLIKAIPDLKSIYSKSEKVLSRNTELQSEDFYLKKEETDTIMIENGVKFKIDWETGQKTGFFLDQRDNRAILGKYATGKSVLNCFCYSGGFSLYALAANATKVTSVDISSGATDLVRENHELNDFKDENHDIITANVMEYLGDTDIPNHDIVIVDPPAFAKSKSKRHNAVQAYKRLNIMALKKVNTGGYLFTFSCSQVVDKPLFDATIRSAAIEVGRNIRVIQSLAQGPDHPTNIYHPEGHYLKGLILQVD